ncbi:MAG: Asp-tRNA(Asn)/Glu-tRNA(Gln) amidotransferase subunit GatB [Dehalococcoidia bacterium]|nr:Asp-tRNA(Asn)/Glu-tRNA(Gln) amidotransferase subunit GatB [Dehalococcoidia bacterium]
MTTTAIDYEAVIGLEVHAQITTRSKNFCSCSADYANAAPNTHVCPVCLGMPGTLPVLNRAAIEATVMTALALNCEIPLHSKFDRKNYPYPDLMKGYQITQYDEPLSLNGWTEIDDGNGGTLRAGITRVHLEEDTARLLHRVDSVTGEPYSLVDVNRAGVPLMEIVGEPDLRTPEQARQYLLKLRQILRYLGVSHANMEEGNFRCDANVSVRPRGSTTFGNKVEVKNMNSFRAVFHALEYELDRQSTMMAAGERIPMETRGWVEGENRTVSQRSKEEANDYRYFPEPDLPPVVLTPDWIEGVRAKLPELPDAKRARFVQRYGLSPHEADLLTDSRARADYFEAALADADPTDDAARRSLARAVANWMLGELARLQNAHGDEIEAVKVRPQHIRELVAVIEGGAISGTQAKDVFQKMYDTGEAPGAIVEAAGLSQISGTDELAAIVAQILAAHPQPVADYRAGKQEAIKFLVGQVMRATKGRANPESAGALLRDTLGG